MWFADSSVGTSSLTDGEEITGVSSFGRDGEVDDAVEASQWENVDETRFLEGDHCQATKAKVILSIRVRDSESWQLPQSDDTTLAFDAASTYETGAVVQKDSWLYRLLHKAQFTSNPADVGSNPATWDTDQVQYKEEDDLGGGNSVWTVYTWARDSVSCKYMNRMRVVLFAAFADPDYDSDPSLTIDGQSTALGAMRIRRIAAWYNGFGTLEEQGCIDSERDFFGDPLYIGQTPLTFREIEFRWSGTHTIEVRNLPPGVRRVLAYGYYENTGNICNAYCSGLQTIELKPGTNHVTVYLNQPLN
jgi:hypothetical protein